MNLFAYPSVYPPVNINAYEITLLSVYCSTYLRYETYVVLCLCGSSTEFLVFYAVRVVSNVSTKLFLPRTSYIYIYIYIY
jgi:hypothetical protein